VGIQWQSGDWEPRPGVTLGNHLLYFLDLVPLFLVELPNFFTLILRSIVLGQIVILSNFLLD
jgi:hypothetical protein